MKNIYSGMRVSTLVFLLLYLVACDQQSHATGEFKNAITDPCFSEKGGQCLYKKYRFSSAIPNGSYGVVDRDIHVHLKRGELSLYLEGNIVFSLNQLNFGEKMMICKTEGGFVSLDEPINIDKIDCFMSNQCSVKILAIRGDKKICFFVRDAQGAENRGCYVVA